MSEIQGFTDADLDAIYDNASQGILCADADICCLIQEVRASRAAAKDRTVPTRYVYAGEGKPLPLEPNDQEIPPPPQDFR